MQSLDRLGVIAQMDPWSASTRYRALQHVPRLRSHFAAVDVSLPGDTLGRGPGRVGQASYFARHAYRYARRGVELSPLLGNSDALLVQRGLYPIGPAAIVRAVSRFDGRLVLDLDDAVFKLSPSLAVKGRAARWLYGPQQTLALLNRADAIVVSTPTLAEMLPAGLPVPTILPTVPDPADYQKVCHEDHLPIRVGWAGTVGGLGYLDPLRTTIERLVEEGLVTLEIVSSHPWGGPGTFRKWSLTEETSVFSRFAVGIMPLPDTEYTRAKAGFKLLQYMAAGIPVVCSPVGINTELVERSHAGFLAESPAEWEAALRQLALDASLRARMGALGRAFIDAYADLDAQAATLAALLRARAPASR